MKHPAVECDYLHDVIYYKRVLCVVDFPFCCICSAAGTSELSLLKSCSSIKAQPPQVAVKSSKVLLSEAVATDSPVSAKDDSDDEKDTSNAPDKGAESDSGSDDAAVLDRFQKYLMKLQLGKPTGGVSVSDKGSHAGACACARDQHMYTFTVCPHFTCICVYQLACTEAVRYSTQRCCTGFVHRCCSCS